ncbi:aminoglycoside phosphotransferase family protein [Nocardia mexicana]|uniref:Phosphotransferase family enzyme n=1 Tax=Nocardia mexicana TaxID=279262 RepID=A0A370H461_9NOCA|nr:aminoglycoside phosphotransferase family protein [Nocardia mexicana]RDI50837.1 phosphotransferase family enzyme [Nocardia mexicana]
MAVAWERTTADGQRAEVISVVRQACSQAGVDASSLRPVRSGSRAYVRLPGDIVARVDSPGRSAVARRVLAVARWLESSDVDAVQCVSPIEQPVEVRGHAVTFWHALPPYRSGTPGEVARALVRLHRMTPPVGGELGPMQPLSLVEQHIRACRTLEVGDRRWLAEHAAGLRRRWAALPAGLPWGVVHGDARSETVVCADDGRVLLRSLDRLAIGPPEWDAVCTAIKLTSFGWITAQQYEEFCRDYGRDVLRWAGFYLLRDIRELHLAVAAARAAARDGVYREQAEYRVRCLRGDEGPRQWPNWRPLWWVRLQHGM